MLPELELEPVGQNGSAPPGPPLGSDGQGSVGGLAHGFTTAWRLGSVGGSEADLAQGLKKLG